MTTNRGLIELMGQDPWWIRFASRAVEYAARKPSTHNQRFSAGPTCHRLGLRLEALRTVAEAYREAGREFSDEIVNLLVEP